MFKPCSERRHWLRVHINYLYIHKSEATFYNNAHNDQTLFWTSTLTTCTHEVFVYASPKKQSVSRVHHTTRREREKRTQCVQKWPVLPVLCMSQTIILRFRSHYADTAGWQSLDLGKQLLDSFKYQLAVIRLFAKYADKRLWNVKSFHKGDATTLAMVSQIIIDIL